MKVVDSFKIDEWWKAVLICGIALIAVGLLFEIEILNRKHLIGVGIGMVIIGLSNWICIKTVVKEYGNKGFFTGQLPVHNTYSKIMQAIGIVISIGFGALLIWGLI